MKYLANRMSLFNILGMEELNQIVSENLSALRKSRHLTQQELADQIGYSDKSISKWELGYAIPTADILLKFSAFYNVSVDYLLTKRKNGEKVKAGNPDVAKKHNQIIITAMAATVVWFTAAAIYATDVINNSPKGSNLWIAFVWAIPVSLLLCAILSHFFWKKCTAFTVFESLFIWTLLLAFYLQFYFYANENLWYIFLVCIPLQIGVILISKLR